MHVNKNNLHNCTQLEISFALFSLRLRKINNINVVINIILKSFNNNTNKAEWIRGTERENRKDTEQISFMKGREDNKKLCVCVCVQYECVFTHSYNDEQVSTTPVKFQFQASSKVQTSKKTKN